jgi:adenylate cyclase
MLVKFREIYRGHVAKYITYSLITAVLGSLFLGWSQILQPLELMIYDFNFWLKPPEVTDERIVVVEWNEENIKAFEETIISDRTLSLLLTKIIEQKPREIGMDIYRDIPVSSPQLTDEQNLEYYHALDDVFRTTDNLRIIAKVVEPVIAAPQILEQKKQVSASDLATDEDRTVRRTYVYPIMPEEGKDVVLEYLGVKLGYEYLAKEGFMGDNVESSNAIKIFKDQASIILKPLKSFVGAPVDDRDSFNLLVNWRKANPAFKQISVIEVLNNRIPANFFTDKIVIIGGTATSTADRHMTPLNRWNQSITYGVDIQAQVASSIVSAALDDRLLINPASKLRELSVIILSAVLIIYIFYQNQNLRSINLYFLTLGYVVGISLFIFILNLFSFKVGQWLPISTAIGNLWILYFVVNYYLYRKQENRRIMLLNSFIGDFNHHLGNRLDSIINSNDEIKDVIDAIEENDYDNINSQQKESIIERYENIKDQISSILKYQDKIRKFIVFGFLDKSSSLEKININTFVNSVVENFINNNDYDYEVEIQRVYDPNPFEDARLIDPFALTVVIENLLDNAFYAVSPRHRNDSNFKPLIEIRTKVYRSLIRKRMEISVRDNGPGIPKKNQQKIFDAFVSYRMGQGIGLFLVNRIAKIYNGSIKVNSTVGSGSTFIFTILCD